MHPRQVRRPAIPRIDLGFFFYRHPVPSPDGNFLPLKFLAYAFVECFVSCDAFALVLSLVRAHRSGHNSCTLCICCLPVH